MLCKLASVFGISLLETIIKLNIPTVTSSLNLINWIASNVVTFLRHSFFIKVVLESELFKSLYNKLQALIILPLFSTIEAAAFTDKGSYPNEPQLKFKTYCSVTILSQFFPLLLLTDASQCRLSDSANQSH